MTIIKKLDPKRYFKEAENFGSRCIGQNCVFKNWI